MAFLDFERFGISEDALRRGDYKYVIGFDLGDGEISAAYAPLAAGSQVSDLCFDSNDNRKIVSGLFVDSAGKVTCGVMPLLQSMRSHKGELLLNFKATPTRLAAGEPAEGSSYTKRELMQMLLANALVRIYNSKNDKSAFAGRGILAVGCPSNRDWTTPEMQELYRRILAEALGRPELKGLGLQLDVMVIPESRASIIKAYKESGCPSDRINRGAIVADHGSSTLDVSMIDFSTNTMLEASIPLGAAKIEREIRREFVRRKERRMSELERAEFDLLETRVAKEAHFSNPDGSPRLIFDFTDGTSARLIINAEYMRTVTHSSPMKYSTSDTANVEGSWSELHLNFLRRMAEWFRGISGASFDGVVMLTGGASRMAFVAENARAIFPDAMIVIDNEPSYCVSRGLAYAVLADTEAIRLSNVVRSNIKNLIQTLYPDFRHAYVKEAAKVVYSYILNELRDWRTNGANVTIDEFKAAVSKRIAGDQGLKERVNNAATAAILAKLNEEGSTGMRARIVEQVNTSFCTVFPGRLSQKAVSNFKLDPAAWRGIAQKFSTNLVLTDAVGEMWFNGLIGEILAAPFRILFGILGIFSEKARDAYSYIDGSGRKLSDSKRAEVLNNYINNTDSYQANIAASIEKAGSSSTEFTERLTEAVMPAVSKAVDNVSLYF